jgi:hypothetical protein
MGAPSSEVSYTSATTRRGDHEVHMDMWWHWEKIFFNIFPKSVENIQVALKSVENDGYFR